MLADADIERIVDIAATARVNARTENREVEAIDSLHYLVVFIL
tara:strand:+ start:17316 stop:17444 length:129 start_codon:yes stop_codon:yes gene_type:complete